MFVPLCGFMLIESFICAPYGALIIEAVIHVMNSKTVNRIRGIEIMTKNNAVIKLGGMLCIVTTAEKK